MILKLLLVIYILGAIWIGIHFIRVVNSYSLEVPKGDRTRYFFMSIFWPVTLVRWRIRKNRGCRNKCQNCNCGKI